MSFTNIRENYKAANKIRQHEKCKQYCKIMHGGIHGTSIIIN